MLLFNPVKNGVVKPGVAVKRWSGLLGSNVMSSLCIATR